jgi:hypothetical protein
MSYAPPADRISGDTGQNASVVAGARKEVAFSTTTAQAVGTTDVSNYRWVSVQTTSQGTSSTITFQGSNDNTNWTSIPLITVGSSGKIAVTSVTGTGMLHGPLAFRYFRLNVTGISAGTTAGTIQFFANPAAIQPPATTTTIGDATAGPAVPLDAVVNLGFNGSTWDRLRTVGTGILSTAPVAATTTGYTPGKLVSAASTNGTNIKASAGTLGYISASNINAAARYLKIYDKASAPTVGTDTPIATFLLPAGAMTSIALPPQGIKCTAGIGIALTTGIADNDTGAVSAAEHVVNYGYA